MDAARDTEGLNERGRRFSPETNHCPRMRFGARQVARRDPMKRAPAAEPAGQFNAARLTGLCRVSFWLGSRSFIGVWRMSYCSRTRGWLGRGHQASGVPAPLRCERTDRVPLQHSQEPALLPISKRLMSTDSAMQATPGCTMIDPTHSSRGAHPGCSEIRTT